MIDFAQSVEKAELHVHIEGTLEPELMFALAERNNIAVPYASVDDVRRAYNFSNLQSFLDIYYQACALLITEQDFYDLTAAYLRRAVAQGLRHAEIFFDPQTHTDRGIPMATVINGISTALRDEGQRIGVSSQLILCFLRHLPERNALESLEAAMPFRDQLSGVGLDSSEMGYPPELFRNVFAQARDAKLRVVAHAGEEGPPEYIWQALDVLGAERVDHGVRSLEDPALVQRLVKDQIPLTVCPLSNVRLRVFDTMAAHPIMRMLESGLLVMINSDDPAYFGGYVGDNYVAVRDALDLDDATLAQLARNGFTASFLDDMSKERHIDSIDKAVGQREGRLRASPDPV